MVRARVACVENRGDNHRKSNACADLITPEVFDMDRHRQVSWLATRRYTIQLFTSLFNQPSHQIKLTVTDHVVVRHLCNLQLRVQLRRQDY